MLEKLLQELVVELELEAVGPKDKEQNFYLQITPTLKVVLKELDPGIFFHAPIGPCPEVKREELFMLLMKANFLGQGTGGGVLGLTGDEKVLTLSLTLPYDMNYKTFKEALEEFTNFLDYWKEEIARFEKEAAESILK